MSKKMFRLLLAAAVAFAAPSLWGQGQQQEQQATSQAKATAEAASQTTAEAGNAAAALKSNTKISAELLSTVDSRTAKPGEEVVARVTKDVKQNGKKVIHKGDHLVGRIQSVEASGAADAGSHVAVMFDRLVQGETTTELHTMVSAIVSTPREMRQQMAEPSPMAQPAPAPSGGGSGGGGLVGGVGSAVGSTVGAAGSAVGSAGSAVGGLGSTVDATSQTALGANAGAVVATPARAIRINTEASGENSTSASSLLSTKEGHLRLESGTQMQFRVAAESEKQAQKSGNAETPRKREPAPSNPRM